MSQDILDNPQIDSQVIQHNREDFESFSNEKTTVVFFASSAILLLLKPFLMVSGILFFTFPEGWEYLVIAAVVVGKMLFSPKYDFFLGLLIWAIVFYNLNISYPSSLDLSLFLLLFFVELLSPSTSPEHWCIFWLSIPSFSEKIFGEPLCPILQASLIFITFLLALETTLPTRSKNSQHPLFMETLSGFLAGLLVVFLYPIPSSQPNTQQKIVFDEFHGTSESSLPEMASNYRHVKFSLWLKKNNFLTAFRKTPFDENVSTDTIYISILPTLAFDPGEGKKILRFVENGGKLLLISDHSDMDGASSRFTPILSTFGITPAFDTITWPGVLKGRFGVSSVLGNVTPRPGTGSGIMFPHFWFPSAFSLNGPKPLLWINGTSLSVQGQSDASLNFQMGSDESSHSTLQPLVTAAWGKFGAGKWAFLSDSSYFQDSQFSQNIDFANGLIKLLSNPDPFQLPTAVIIFIVLLVVFCFPFFYRSSSSPFFFLAIFAGLLCGNPLEGRLFPSQARNQPLQAFMVCNKASLSGVTADQPKSFFSNLDEMLEIVHESGWETHLVDSIKAIPRQESLIILSSGINELSQNEIKRLERRISSGSTLILFAEPQNPEMNDLIATFGFSISQDVEDYYPWQRTHLNLIEKAEYPPYRCFAVPHPDFTGWDSQLWSDFPVPVFGGKAILKRSDDKTIAAINTHKNGKVILFGDNTFFTNHVLEIKGILEDKTKKKYLKWLMEKILDGYKK
ncbi:MAG: DUF4350 domain-containing protein [Candidatus Riflebacteria bacterium]|nr:DUF4350 domain-containing protein [Candidatus Riflebacteria bacterium]